MNYRRFIVIVVVTALISLMTLHAYAAPQRQSDPALSAREAQLLVKEREILRRLRENLHEKLSGEETPISAAKTQIVTAQDESKPMQLSENGMADLERENLRLQVELAKLEASVRTLRKEQAGEDPQVGSAALQALNKAQHELTALQLANRELRQELDAARKRAKNLASDLAAGQKQLSTGRQRDEANMRGVSANIDKLQRELKEQNKSIAELRKTNEGLTRELEIAQVRARELLQTVTGRERQIEVLDQQVQKLFGLVDLAAQVSDSPEGKISYHVSRLRLAELIDQLPVATIMSKRADLFTGPEPENTVMLTFPRGTRLGIETRVDDWYRVITPQGTRGWIQSNKVAFAARPQGTPGKILRIKGYDGAVEGEGY